MLKLTENKIKLNYIFGLVILAIISILSFILALSSKSGYYLILVFMFSNFLQYPWYIYCAKHLKDIEYQNEFFDLRSSEKSKTKGGE